MAIASNQNPIVQNPIAPASARTHLSNRSESSDDLLSEVRHKIKAQLGRQAITENVAVEDVAVEDMAAETRCLSQTLPISQGFQPEPVAQAPTSAPPALSLQAEAPTFETLNIRQMAAEGYFQAIAYWLNESLVPQNVYAKVLADEVPGRIKVLIEFEREPKQERLVRFVCDRLYKLDSDVIQGVHLIVRPIGATRASWEKAVRLPTATERRQTEQRQTEQRQRSTRRVSKQAISRSISRSILQTRFKILRAAFVCGATFAALVIGGAMSGFFDLFLLDRLASPVAGLLQKADDTPSTGATPWYGETNEPDIFRSSGSQFDLSNRNREIPSATAISFRPASRFAGRTVEAALETVAVIPHDNVANPSDPTVTLMFGGELALNDFIFKDTTDLDTLFSDIDIYQQADVTMMGLAEPLAYASTSLQEDFHRRTRPQAVRTLKSGGIDIVGIAGDGSMTYGARGLSETLNNLDRQGIYHIGAGRNQQEAHRPEILEVKGQRIAYLGYSSDALKLADKERAGVALNRTAQHSYIAEDITAIRDQVDWVVVNYRWGESDPSADPAQADVTQTDPTQTDGEANAAVNEDGEVTRSPLASAPEDWQKELAYEAVDAGADLVVGSHPNQIQGVEIYRDRPIAYSLGNFAFSRDPQTDSLTARDTTALKVSLRNQRMKVELLPVTLENAKLRRASGESGTHLLQSIRRASQVFEEPLSSPAVLKPKPHVLRSPSAEDKYQNGSQDSTSDWTPDPDAVPVPESPDAMPGVIEVIQAEPVESPAEAFSPADQVLSEPTPEEDYPEAAPHPMLKESEALFMLEENGLQSEPDGDLLDEPAEELLEQQLDRQWQNEEWQKELQEAEESWETSVDNVDDGAYQATSEEAYDDAELYPWQDPFASEDESLGNAETASDRFEPLPSRSIRPYAEPLIGPLSSTPTLPNF